jgi:hypothetical protein
VTTILIDYNVEGHAQRLWQVLQRHGWLELIPLEMTTFAELLLPKTATDRTVWRTAQNGQMLLLTANRNMDGLDSLEQVIREENHQDAFPVLTIASADRLVERDYCTRCALRIVEIVLDLENHRGIGRIFIP